jgi:hypothetical protein
MADGDAHGFGDSTFLVKIVVWTYHFQEFRTHRLRMTFIGDSSFRKVCSLLSIGSVIEYLLYHLGQKGSIMVANAWYVVCPYQLGSGHLSEISQGNLTRP